ncbi:hypothetical protein L9F63_000303 [Diploptera punctata]|uniref:Uncharacterized protein n=1 Tax=Diploptera punctata TaxID=6984 RepID=A0AAD8AMP9_DIPPU|nr:hypothetical protein L9F63_000303 [Diploptera punctata]
MDLRWLLVLSFLLLAQSHGAKILGLFPFPARSHLIVQKALMVELAKRGHQVTILTHFLEKEPVPNLTEIYLETDFKRLEGGDKGDVPKNLFDMSKIGIFEMTMMMLMMGKPLCEKVLEEESVQRLIHEENLHFDLVVIEAFVNECMLGFAHKFNATVIQVCPYGGSQFMADWVGSPNPYSYVPDELLNFRDKMSFSERLINSVVGALRQIGRYTIHLPAQDEAIRKYFNTSEPIPYITELEKRTALVLLNFTFFNQLSKAIVSKLCASWRNAHKTTKETSCGSPKVPG